MAFPHRRVIISLGMLISLGLTIGWLFYFPFSEARLYRGAAPHAALVSEHDRLAERWDDLLANPQLTEIVTAAAGTPAGEGQALLDLLARDDVARLVRLVGRERVVVSYVPLATPRGFACWTASAWVGGTTQLLRWGWLDRTLGELKPSISARGIKAWHQPLELDDKAYHLGMVACEGVVTLTLSRDPASVAWMANRLLSDASITTVNGLALPTGVAPGSPDRIALRPQRLDLYRGIPGSLRTDVNAFDATGLDLTLCWRTNLPIPALSTTALPALPIPAAMPAALACTSISNLTTVLDQLLPPATVTQLRPLLALARPSSPVGIALGTAPYSGRLMGVRTPSLLACARAGVLQEQLGAQLRALVDRTVAATGTGLIVSESKTWPGMLVVSLAQNPTLAMLGRADLCALAIRADWLYLSSSPTTLATCLAELDRGEATFDGQRIWGEQPAAAALWVNAEPATATLVNGMAVYNLIAMFGGGKGMPRLDTPAITRALELAATLGEGRAWCTTEANALTARLRFQ